MFRKLFGLSGPAAKPRMTEKQRRFAAEQSKRRAERDASIARAAAASGVTPHEFMCGIAAQQQREYDQRHERAAASALGMDLLSFNEWQAEDVAALERARAELSAPLPSERLFAVRCSDGALRGFTRAQLAELRACNEACIAAGDREAIVQRGRVTRACVEAGI